MRRGPCRVRRDLWDVGQPVPPWLCSLCAATVLSYLRTAAAPRPPMPDELILIGVVLYACGHTGRSLPVAHVYKCCMYHGTSQT